MQKTFSAGGIVLNKKRQILVVQQHNNVWSLPKGHIDPGETALQAAEREIAEESGITKLTLVQEIGKYERHRIAMHGGDDTAHLKHIHMFLFTTTQQKLQPTDPTHPQARWVDKDQVAELLTHKKDKEFFTNTVPSLKL